MYVFVMSRSRLKPRSGRSHASGVNGTATTVRLTTRCYVSEPHTWNSQEMYISCPHLRGKDLD